MQVTFKIHFHAQMGHRLAISGDHPVLGCWNLDSMVWMTHLGDGNWSAELNVPTTEPMEFSYKYLLVHGDHLEWEDGRNRRAFIHDERDHLICHDYWRSSRDQQNTLFSNAFAKNIMARDTQNQNESKSSASQVFRFQIFAPRIDKGHHLILTGNDPALGNWDLATALDLDASRFPLWKIEFTPSLKERQLEYKFGIKHTESGKVTTLEEGKNRKVWVPSESGKTLYIHTDSPFIYPLGNWKGAGCAIPVSALRTQNSMGVGEFLDLKTMVDWVKNCGLKLIQVLPINDTHTTGSIADSSPYSANSSFALHPIYLNLGRLAEHSMRVTPARLKALKDEFNEIQEVNYPVILKKKMELLRSLYEEERHTFLAAKSTRDYFEENRGWLFPYALFQHFLVKFGSSYPQDWEDYADYNYCLENLSWTPNRPFYEEIGFHVFVQYHLHSQLMEACQYARKNHIVLKGDIPIGVKRESVDTWVYPELFNMKTKAGAPPDYFAKMGQNWGMPTYNWEKMKQNGFLWWKNRLNHMAQYFDAFRVDHILGFFRIWSIPEGAIHGLLGVFNKSVPIHIDELFNQGIPFDYERMSRPYITETILDSRFGSRKQQVMDQFLEPALSGRYQFKREFDTQEKIDAFFEKRKSTDSSTTALESELRDDLLYLHTEILLIESPYPNSQLFHPRHSMQQTRSFKELDVDTQAKLDHLYVDYFFSRQEDFWRLEGLWKLPALKYATNMLICGEDLGMVPKCVPHVMEELNILGLRIQRMPGDPKEKYGHPSDYPYLTVCTTSSHDMSPIRAWWEENRDKNQEFYEMMLGKKSPAPYFAEDWLCREIITQHLYSRSMWAVFPIQDLLAMDPALRRENPFAEQINNPNNPSHHWNYRLHIPIETLQKAKAFNIMLREMIQEAGRGSDY